MRLEQLGQVNYVTEGYDPAKPGIVLTLNGMTVVMNQDQYNRHVENAETAWASVWWLRGNGSTWLQRCAGWRHQ